MLILKFVVGGISRHPNGKINLFTDMLERSLCKIRQSNTASITAGDIHIFMSKYNEHLCTTNYVNTLIANNKSGQWSVKLQENHLPVIFNT